MKALSLFVFGLMLVTQAHAGKYSDDLEMDRWICIELLGGTAPEATAIVFPDVTREADIQKNDSVYITTRPYKGYTNFDFDPVGRVVSIDESRNVKVRLGFFSNKTVPAAEIAIARKDYSIYGLTNGDQGFIFDTPDYVRTDSLNAAIRIEALSASGRLIYKSASEESNMRINWIEQTSVTKFYSYKGRLKNGLKVGSKARMAIDTPAGQRKRFRNVRILGINLITNKCVVLSNKNKGETGDNLFRYSAVSADTLLLPY